MCSRRVVAALVVVVIAASGFYLDFGALVGADLARRARGPIGVVQARTKAPATDGFDEYFIDKTMRIDYFHSGGRGIEVLALDEVISDGRWSGSRTRLVDDLNLGKYLFEVVDRRTHRVIYSRGFASIYGEWERTPSARMGYATFHESLRFPWPQQAVQVILKVRDQQNSFYEIWSTEINPNSRFVSSADRAPSGDVWPIIESGSPTVKVDLLVVGDGYTAGEMPKFHADAERLVDALFDEEPFASRRADFNVWGLELPSPQSGVSRPRAMEFRRTPLSVEYNIFDSER